jgi:hypothetical protein
MARSLGGIRGSLRSAERLVLFFVGPLRKDGVQTVAKPRSVIGEVEQGERLLYSRRQTAHVLGGVSLRTIKELEASGQLDVVRLNKRSPTAQVFHRAWQVQALARG